ATASTGATASTDTGATAPAAKATHTSTKTTGSTHAPHTATQAKPPPKPPRSAPEQSPAVNKVLRQVTKPTGKGTGEVLPPKSHRYPRFIQAGFIASCKSAKGSHSSCECIIIKQEARNVEKGQSMAELIALELELKHGLSLRNAAHHRVLLPSGVQRSAELCAGK